MNDSTNRLPDLMTLSEVAEYLRVHQNTVRNYVKEGKLQQCGKGRPRFIKDDVVRFLESTKSFTTEQIQHLKQSA